MTIEPRKKSEPDRPTPEVTDLYRKLEERAIAESNDLNRRVTQCRLCSRGDLLPAVGSGHPLADIFLVKYMPRYQEAVEGVAFYGRSGSAILKSMERMNVDPLLLYGTNVVKCPGIDQAQGEANCPTYFLEEFHITQPRLLVIMGRETLELVNQAMPEGTNEIEWSVGKIQDLTPFCKALVTPDIDGALDDADAKRAFWGSFRVLGEWFRDEPPY